ncbi:Nuclear protein localization protein 4 [Astathelohania contejeani]|uniref:Nuclear protein localization protein 4 n=1 Tax=Astathelohania contejeani TaxID=164912 RepID=A0ABQ7I1Q6_9MICR|nr:Nuclear protein localization protein 4 [Thelohania contejeani]
MILRVKGPTKQIRIEISEKDTLHQILATKFETSKFTLSKDKGNTDPIPTNVPVGELGLAMGEIIYIHHEPKINKEVKPDSKEITRGRDNMLCQHGDNAMCSHCAPLDPWNQEYHAEKKIKYLSFKSYEAMLKNAGHPVEMESYVQKTCSDHGDNIRCMKCQIPNIRLLPQSYRMIDHIEFDNSEVVDKFISFWRGSARQRFGILLGRYEKYEMVPLGTKAVVSWVYEPVQESYPDGFIIKEENILRGNDSSSAAANDIFKIISSLGLFIVGMIYTNLSQTVNYNVSSLEADFIARMQLFHPFIINGLPFNSQFVTIIVKKGEEGVILEEYQVSNQCMALIRDGIIIPTEDPNKFMINEENPIKPSLSYKKKNEYDIVTTIQADPYLPVDYLLVRLTHGFKHNPLFKSTKYFDYNFNTKKMALYFNKEFELEDFSNFNLLVKLYREYPRVYEGVIDAVKENNKNIFKEFIKSDIFLEFREELRRYESESWACQMCTFINERNPDTCEMCALPRRH